MRYVRTSDATGNADSPAEQIICCCLITASSSSGAPSMKHGALGPYRQELKEFSTFLSAKSLNLIEK